MTHMPDESPLALPVEELLRRASAAPAAREMVIDDLTLEEGEAFLQALP